jgi:hypothetical protein
MDQLLVHHEETPRPCSYNMNKEQAGRFLREPSIAAWVASVVTVILMTVIVLATADDGISSHLLEIIGAAIGVHVAVRFAKRGANDKPNSSPQ